MKRDVLAELERLLDATPHDHYVCAPLKRSVVAAATAEIRRLRSQVAQLVAIGDKPQPRRTVRRRKP